MRNLTDIEIIKKIKKKTFWSRRVNEMKYAIQSHNIRAEQEEERISEQEDRNFEITESEEEKE